MQGSSGLEILESRAISVSFGGLSAISDNRLTLARRQIVGLIGPNGAGKSTLINVLTGFQRPSSGVLLLDGIAITAWPPERIARRGVARTFQSVRLFSDLTVRENVAAAMASRGQSRRRALDGAMDVLDALGLADKAERIAGELPYGEERRVGIARALAPGPRFLLLDEPAAGLNTREVEQLMLLIGFIRDRYECGILVVEHNMNLIMAVCERLHVLDGGRTIAEGGPEQVQSNPAVRAAYLGTRH